MRPFPLFGEDAKPDSAIQSIIADAVGPILTLDAAPTASNATSILPKHMNIGHVLGVVYINLNGVVYKSTFVTL